MTGTPKAYLAHLSRGSELLRSEKIDDARDELEQALALHPGDARTMNLLGLVYFRLGRYPDAQAIYADLVKRQPHDAALRLNLGLVHLKQVYVDDAIRELNRARELDPAQLRTMGYLGLAFARKGHFALARDAFQAAGQEELAREMEQQLATELSAARKLPQPQPQRPPSNGAPAQAATPPVEPPAPPPPPPPAPESSWQLTASASLPPASSPVPVPAPAPASVSARTTLPGFAVAEPAPGSLVAVLERRLIRPDAGDAAFEVNGQALVVRVRGRILTRQSGVVATGGQVAFTPANRRVRGRETADAFTGEGGMSLAAGQGHIVALARNAVFTTLQLGGESLYLREDLVFAFEERLSWENGHVPGSNGSIPILQLRGEGGVAVRIHGALLGIEVRSEATLDVHASALAGWTGRVVPRLVTHPGGRGHTVEMSGEGAVFIEEPRA